MKLTNETITVKYQTQKNACACCGRDFDEIKLGEIREFDITLKAIFDYASWQNISDIYEEEVPAIVGEYIFETISFHALNSNDTLKLCEGELDKVVEKVIQVKKNN